MEEKYLQDAIEVDDIWENKLNIVKAPCGSGKTTFALEILLALADKYSMYPMIYLIDTRNGKDGIKHKIVEAEEIYGDFKNVEVMTYAYFGKHATEFDNENLFIICDELSACVEYAKIKNNTDNWHETALGAIYTRIVFKDNYVVALDATPQPIFDYFDFDSECINEVPLYSIVKTLKQEQIVEFSNINTVINTIDATQRGLIYTNRVRDMQKIIALLQHRGINAAGYWSTANTDNPMTSAQLDLRKTIITTGYIPKDIQVLVINKSSERSINILTQVDYVIVDDVNADVQIQARGRIRHDIKTLYIKKWEAEDAIVVPDEFLGIKLSKTDKDRLCERLGIRENGRLCKWTIVKDYLIRQGYQITDKSGTNGRYSVISI